MAIERAEHIVVQQTGNTALTEAVASAGRAFQHPVGHYQADLLLARVEFDLCQGVGFDQIQAVGRPWHLGLIDHARPISGPGDAGNPQHCVVEAQRAIGIEAGMGRALVMTVDVEGDVLPARRKAGLLAEQLGQLRVDPALAQDFLVERSSFFFGVRRMGQRFGFKADQAQAKAGKQMISARGAALGLGWTVHWILAS
ncbi:hypothetical protein D3C77_355970 [compost metagenome]